MTLTASRPTASRRPPDLALLLTGGSTHPWVVNLCTWAAAVLMIVSGYIHLHLYAIAYKHIPTIGPLFIVQGVVSILLAMLAAAVRRVWTALISAGTMLATGFLISVNYGLFGFQDAFTGTNAVGAFVIEVTSAVLFLAAAVLSITGRTARSAAADGTARP